MYKYFTPGLLFFLLALLVASFPHFFVLRKYEKEFESFFSERFRLFHFFQLAWMVISASVCILIIVFLPTDNHSLRFAAWSIFFASMALPSAVFSAFTGIYPEIGSKGYHYYERYSTSSQPISVIADYSRLKMVGWIQFVFLAVLISLSAAYIL